MDRVVLETLNRDDLIAKAEAAGVLRARVLTRPELVDEILLRDAGKSTDEIRRSRGFLGRARDLLARVVERGLHLPDAAERIRGLSTPPRASTAPQAVPTVTLAEIYATQGHKKRAVETLEQVITSEPDHVAARELLSKLVAGAFGSPEPILPPESDEIPANVSSLGSSDLGGGRPPGPPPEPSSMLDSKPLPSRYDVDECIALSVDPSTVYVYWEIKDDTFAQLRQRMPEGRVNLRVLIMLPTWDGPRAYQRDIDAQASVGDWFVRDLPENAVVRAAVGWQSTEGVFVSAAHSRGVESARSTMKQAISQWFARWTPEATIGLRGDEPESLKLARALARIEATRLARLGEQAENVDATGIYGRARRLRMGSSDEVVLASSWS